MCLSLCLSVSLPASLPLLLKCLQKVYLQRTLAVTAVSSPQLCSFVSDIKCPPPWHGYIQWFIISHNRLGLVTWLIVVMFIVYLLYVKSAWKYKMVHMDSFNIFCNHFKIVFFFFFLRGLYTVGLWQVDELMLLLLDVWLFRAMFLEPTSVAGLRALQGSGHFGTRQFVV